MLKNKMVSSISFLVLIFSFNNCFAKVWREPQPGVTKSELNPVIEPISKEEMRQVEKELNQKYYPEKESINIPNPGVSSIPEGYYEEDIIEERPIPISEEEIIEINRSPSFEQDLFAEQVELERRKAAGRFQ